MDREQDAEITAEFQFWILHSIEQRVNKMAERLDAMEGPARNEGRNSLPR